MRGALAVRINDGQVDRHVTRHVHGLRFRKTAPGGHHSASVSLTLPRSAFSDLGPADKVYIYDPGSGRTVWEGYADNPGASDGPQGQGFDLSAMGGMILASDESRALIYVDRGFDMWTVSFRSIAALTGESTAPPDLEGQSVLLLSMPRGVAVGNETRVSMQYDGIKAAGLKLGGFRSSTASGLLDLDYVTEWTTEANVVIRARNANTTLATFTEASAGDAFVVDTQIPRVRWRRQSGGATNIATDTVWTYLSGVWVRQLLVTKTGAEITGAGTYADGYVVASQVVADLIGRVLKMVDPAASVIDTTTYQIDQLAYHEGAKSASVLNDLALYEPDFVWEVLESTSAGHRFNYRAWPTTPRYEISVKDGYSSPGGEADLCNRIAVYWADAKGQAQMTTVTQTVEALGTRTRDADSVTLPDGMGSAANAQRVGERILATKKSPPKAATARVRRPLLDQVTGAMVMPWEIEPGYVVRVRETGDDLRLTEMEYDDADRSATLTLGEPQRTQEQLLAALSRQVA